MKHDGVKETLTEFRSKYWVTKSRSFVQKILYKCVLCRYLNSRPYVYPKCPDLPKTMLKDDYAFSATGVDHFGPLYCKNDFRSDLDENKMHKCHVLLYTCASTRGLVLDSVPDTSAKEFIDSFRRFIARRGCPQEMLSDNGSAFIAEETQTFVVGRNVKWHFSSTLVRWYMGKVSSIC